MVYFAAAAVVFIGVATVSVLLFLFGCATLAIQQAEEADEDEFQDW